MLRAGCWIARPKENATGQGSDANVGLFIAASLAVAPIN